jgi:hypothetical protein
MIGLAHTPSDSLLRVATAAWRNTLSRLLKSIAFLMCSTSLSVNIGLMSFLKLTASGIDLCPFCLDVDQWFEAAIGKEPEAGDGDDNDV